MARGRSSRWRWIPPCLLAILLHLLLLWFGLPRVLRGISPAAGESVEDAPMMVQLFDMSPDGEHDSRGEEPDRGQELQTLREPPRDVVDPADMTAGGDPDAPVAPPTEPPPSFSIADITMDGSDDAPLAREAPLIPAIVAPPSGAVPASAPEGVCRKDHSLCVYDNGDVHEIHPSLTGAVAERVDSGRLVAVSDAEVEGRRDQFQGPASPSETTDGMGIYRNYGRVAGHQHVDLQRLSEASSGAPHDCRIYPEALKFEDEEPAALVIVIDSSRSMNRNKYTSPATRCAWAAAESALEYEIPVGVINFSEKLYVAEESKDEQYIAEVICKSQKGGTVLPESELEELVVDEDVRRDLLLITDGEIANLSDALPHLQSVLERHPGNRGIALLIDRALRYPARRPLQGIGFRVTLLRF